MPKSTDIATLLQFTPDDLDLNRQGKLSPGQIGRLQVLVRAQRIYYLLILGFAVILSIVIDVAFSIKLQPGLAFATIILTIIIVLVGIGFVVYVSARAQRNLAGGSIYSAQGKVSSIKYRKNSSSNYDYFVHIQNVRFKVPDSTFAAFHNGHNYIVYYVTLMRNTIVAAEEIT